MNYAQNTGNKHLFYLLIATICRPKRKDLSKFKADLKNWNGDERVVYNGIDSEERAKIFEHVPLGTLTAVLQYWEAMNNRFVKRNDELFHGTDESPLFVNGEGCLSLLEDVAEEGIMGDLDKVHETNIASLFMYLRHKSKKIERREKELQKENK
jgi:hypothetical protein